MKTLSVLIASTNISIYTRTHLDTTHIQTHAHTHIHTNKHTHTHIHIHAHLPYTCTNTYRVIETFLTLYTNTVIACREMLKINKNVIFYLSNKIHIYNSINAMTYFFVSFSWICTTWPCTIFFQIIYTKKLLKM